ncbi:MAG: leucyl aminopeptidase family protein [Bdellovibrionota bacterium]
MDFEIVKKGQEFKDKIELIVDISYDETIAETLKSIEAKDYSKELKKRINDKVKEFKQFKKYEYYKSFHFQTEAGTHLIVLVLRKSIKSFEIQVALRKSLLETLKELKGNVILNIDEISKAHQEAVADFYATLTKIGEWKSPVYGKKAKEQSSEKKKETKKKTFIQSQIKDSDLQSITSKGSILGEANNLVRTLASMPSNVLNPLKYQDILQERAQKGKYIYRFIDVNKLQNMNAGSFLAVLSADPKSEGGIAHLTYKPKNKSHGKICLVGKGLCFDTGGYNVKTGTYMYTMHRDMTGSAVALALFEALIQLQLPYEIHGLLAIAENHISPTGYKPNDVVEAMNGVSIEVVDTDAEGRMVLCDTLCYASELKPDVIIDYATLTGAAVRSIGTARSAVFSNNKKLIKTATEAGDTTGERVWSFPIGDDYREMIKSEIADIKQCQNVPGPDHILAATFLSEFVEESIPWLHVDLSSEENTGGLGIVDSDVSGFGVRLGLEVVEKFLASK